MGCVCHRKFVISFIHAFYTCHDKGIFNLREAGKREDLGNYCLLLIYLAVCTPCFMFTLFETLSMNRTRSNTSARRSESRHVMQNS